MERIFTVDGNYYLHRLFHTIGTTSKNPGPAIANAFLAKVCKEALSLRADYLIVSFDGDAVFRYDIYPEYKGERGDNDEVYTHLPSLLRLLKSAGIPVIQKKKVEADDVMCSMAHKYHDTHTLYMGVRDKDAFQYLLWSSVMLYDSSNKVGKTYVPLTLTEEHVIAKTGLLPSQQRSYQALIGDKVDNIPSILGPATARKGLLKHKTIKAWCAADPEFRKVIQSVRPQLDLNNKLVTLVPDLKLPPLRKVMKSENTELPRAYWDYMNFLYPKTKGLFR